jgi:ribosome-associated protein YbcJ (S4-like RNA binding protein)
MNVVRVPWVETVAVAVTAVRSDRATCRRKRRLRQGDTVSFIGLPHICEE